VIKLCYLIFQSLSSDSCFLPSPACIAASSSSSSSHYHHLNSPHLAASVILTALNNNDIGPGRSAIDLGCGTGILAIGCALVETDWVVGVDCDSEAIQVALENVLGLELEDQVSFVLDRVRGPIVEKTEKEKRRGGRTSKKPTPHKAKAPSTTIGGDYKDGISLSSKCVDTVLTNPPFGTKNNAGIDVCFLKAATRLARRSVYSFHKTSTRPFLLKTVQEWGMKLEVVAEMKFDLPKVYSFHKEKSRDIEVDLLRISIPRSDENENGEEDHEEGNQEEQDPEVEEDFLSDEDV
jgi:predicted RNA methylase